MRTKQLFTLLAPAALFHEEAAEARKKAVQEAEAEEAVREERVTFSWGEGIGFYHGEANLKKAIRKKECWWVKIKGFDGQIHKRLQRVNFIGTPVYQMSCSLEIKDHKRIKLLPPPSSLPPLP